MFQDWIRDQAAIHDVDGCTGVTNWNAICCLQHDLEFKFGKSASSAYQYHVKGHPEPWAVADATTYEQANDHFKNCNFRENRLGYWNPFAWIRYGVGRLRKTRAAWDKHRAAEQAEFV